MKHLEKYGLLYLLGVVAILLTIYYDPFGLFGGKGGSTVKEESSLSFPLKRGDEGEKVRTLQIRMNEAAADMPLLPIEEDGVFGENTEMLASNLGILSQEGVTQEQFQSLA